MESKVNYTLVGIFVVLFSLAIIVAAFWLSASYPYHRYQYYLVYMNESVSGLSPQSPVKFNGVEVGVVQEINLNEDNFKQVELLLKVKQDAPISASTVAALNLQGITGVTYIGLRSLTAQAPPLKALPGQKYPVITYEPSLLVTLDNAVTDITQDIKAVSDSFKRIFDEENARAIKNTLDNLQQFTEMLAQNSQKFDSMIDNFSTASVKLSPLLTEAQDSLAALRAMADKAALTMDSSNVMVQNISNQAVPSAVDVLNRLTAVTTNLEAVTASLRRDPSVIVRGKVPAQAGPGE